MNLNAEIMRESVEWGKGVKRECRSGAGQENGRQGGMSGMRSFFFMEKNVKGGWQI